MRHGTAAAYNRSFASVWGSRHMSQETAPCRLQEIFVALRWRRSARQCSLLGWQGPHPRAGLQAEVVQTGLTEALLQLCSARRIRNALPMSTGFDYGPCSKQAR